MKAPFLSSFTEKHYKQGGTDFKSDQHFFGPFLKYEKQSEQDMKVISELDTNTSLFFNHQTPEAVEMFKKMISERKEKMRK